MKHLSASDICTASAPVPPATAAVVAASAARSAGTLATVVPMLERPVPTAQGLTELAPADVR